MNTVEFVGPILFARGADRHQARLSALLIVPQGTDCPALKPCDGVAGTACKLIECAGHIAWRIDFELPAMALATYRVGDQVFSVCTDLTAGIRIAYVSCNGQEHDDLAREPEERNRHWQRLLQEHRRAPFALLLQGGDQLYADEVLQAHESLQHWQQAELEDKGSIAWCDQARLAAEHDLFQRYRSLYAQPGMAPLLAEVPSIMMWDDHDIIDGWGSHPAPLLDSPVGRGLFEMARRQFLVFQQARTEAEAEAYGPSLSLTASFPRLSIIAPDLRSERRPDRILGERGWQMMEQALMATTPLPRRILMSSVPLLGPRLSWVERLSPWVPRLQRYEDDLRDQWQSRAHRAEWQRLLRLLDEQTGSNQATTVVSGEIHLATRGEMPLSNHTTLHQLVASGISHPAPPAWYARALGWLAVMGEDPLPEQPIRLHPLPGQRRIYAAERNFLVLERQTLQESEHWTARWMLEDSGMTAPLPI